MKILVVRDIVNNLNWMNHLPDPLKPNQKVVVSNNQEDVDELMYVRVKHGNGSVSVFNKSYFKPLGK